MKYGKKGNENILNRNISLLFTYKKTSLILKIRQLHIYLFKKKNRYSIIVKKKIYVFVNVNQKMSNVMEMMLIVILIPF